MAIASILWLACLHVALPDEPHSQTRAEDDRIREVVFRRILRRHMEGSIVFFAFEDGTDPPASFLARFSGMKLKIRPVSRCRIGSGGYDGESVVDRVTGKLGERIRVDNPEWSGEGRVWVGYSLHRSPENGYRGVFEVVRRDGKWEVGREVHHAEY